MSPLFILVRLAHGLGSFFWIFCMKLKQLQCIAAIVQSGFNVTAAADKLHLSQPAVSKQIKLAEELLGLPISAETARRWSG